MGRGTGSTPGTDAPRAVLAREMRRIKGVSGLSFGRLANRTHYSRSSWERILNGKQLPTKVAVEQFAEAAGEDPGPLHELLRAALHESEGPERPTEAEASAAAPTPAGQDPEQHRPEQRPAPSADVAVSEPPVPPVPPVPSVPAIRPHTGRADRVPGWRRTAHAAGLVAVGALLGAMATALTIGDAGGSDRETGRTSGQRTPQPAQTARLQSTGPAVAAQPKPGCRSDACIGREPQSMDCQWDAVTVRTAWLRGLHIQLRYSAACQAVWGRVENGAVGDTVTIKNRFGREQSASIRVGTDTYTRMLAVSPDAPRDTVVVCGAIPSQRERECSPNAPIQP